MNETEITFGPVRTSTEDEVLACQQAINDHAAKFGVTPVTRDGVFGPDTLEAFESVAWYLGLDRSQAPESDGRAWEILKDPDVRLEEERRIAASRLRIQGVPLTSDEVVFGLAALQSIDEWPNLINRRVEKLAFASDLLTFQSRQSVDFDASAVLRPPDAWRLGGSGLVPLTHSTKWVLKSVNLLDETDRSLPLATKRQHGTLGASILIALAYLVGQDSAPPNMGELLPREIAEDLRAIAHEDAHRAERIWESLGSTRSNSPLAAPWRYRLIESERFMTLAYDLARTFLLSAVIPCGNTEDPDAADGMGRRLVKLDCVRPARRPRRRIGLTADNRLMISEEKPMRPIPRAGIEGAGHICIQTTTHLRPHHGPLGSFHTKPIEAFLITKRPTGEQRRVAWVSNGDTWAANLPAGEYEVQADPAHTYHMQGDSAKTVTLDVGDSKTIDFAVRETRITLLPTGAFGDGAPKSSLKRRILRSVGLISQIIVIQLKMDEGGSLHFETEAPLGLQITRAKIITHDGEIVDIELNSTQVAHLYVPEHLARPAVGYAIINLRPREETVIRAAITSALLAACLLIAIATKWWVTGVGVKSGVTIALAVPGVFSAYAAQGAIGSITNSIVYGLRGLALLPGACCFAAATFIATTSSISPSGRMELTAIAAISALAAIALWFVGLATRHPVEQMPTARAQGKRFAERYPVGANVDLSGTGLRWRITNWYHLTRAWIRRPPGQ